MSYVLLLKYDCFLMHFSLEPSQGSLRHSPSVLREMTDGDGILVGIFDVVLFAHATATRPTPTSITTLVLNKFAAAIDTRLSAPSICEEIQRMLPEKLLVSTDEKKNTDVEMEPSS